MRRKCLQPKLGTVILICANYKKRKGFFLNSKNAVRVIILIKSQNYKPAQNMKQVSCIRYQEPQHARSVLVHVENV